MWLRKKNADGWGLCFYFSQGLFSNSSSSQKKPQKHNFKFHEVFHVFQTLVSLTLAHQNAVHRALRPQVLAKTVTNFAKDILRSLHSFGSLLMTVKRVFV